jgi:hypothetical protein
VRQRPRKLDGLRDRARPAARTGACVAAEPAARKPFTVAELLRRVREALAS